MEKEIIKTKKELVEMLQNFITETQNNEGNVFKEAELVMYANNGINKLEQLNVSDDTLVKMYDIDNVLYFEKNVSKEMIKYA